MPQSQRRCGFEQPRTERCKIALILPSLLSTTDNRDTDQPWLQDRCDLADVGVGGERSTALGGVPRGELHRSDDDGAHWTKLAVESS
jgi:hypothetical protein